MGQLLALGPMKSSSDTSKLRLLHHNVQFGISTLEGLEVSPDQHVVVLNSGLM